MRRTLTVVFALLLAAMPGVALAQSPAPAGPPAFEIAPGVVGEGLAFLPGATDPVVYRLRFEPGSAYDAVGDASVALVTIESGSMTITAPVELAVYSATGDRTPRTETAGSAVTMETGDTFLFPAEVDAHLTNDGADPASLIVAALYIPLGPMSPSARTHRWLLPPPPEPDPIVATHRRTPLSGIDSRCPGCYRCRSSTAPAARNVGAHRFRRPSRRSLPAPESHLARLGTFRVGPGSYPERVQMRHAKPGRCDAARARRAGPSG